MASGAGDGTSGGKTYADFMASQRSRLVQRNDLQKFKANAGSDSFHTYDPREKERYTTRINKIMAKEPDFVPLSPHGSDLWKAVSDGKWLCKFLNRCQPSAVDETVFNKKLTGPMAKLEAMNGVNPWANTENLNAFLEAAREVGLEFGAVGATDFAKADEAHKEHLVLGVLWQLLRRQLANEIKEILAKQAADAETMALNGGASGSAEEAEAAKAAMAKALKDPETFLCEWVNATLAEQGIEGVVASSIAELSTSNSDILVQLVNSLESTETSAAGLGQEDPVERANAVIAWASEHSIPSLSQADDLRDTNPRLILPFVMGLFAWYHTHKANKGAAADDTLSSVFVIRQHWHVHGEAPSCSSNSIVAFKKEDEALRYVVAENLVLVGTDADLPHLLTMVSEYATASGYEDAQVLELLGPIPDVLAQPAEVEVDDADLLRGRVEVFVKSAPFAALKSYQETISAILHSHPTVKVYDIDNCQLF